MRFTQRITFQRSCHFIRSGWKVLKEVSSTVCGKKERQILNSCRKGVDFYL